MAKEANGKQDSLQAPSKSHKKLPKLPPNAKVHKRPLLHPQLASPYAGPRQTKIIYVSTNTPFLSAVKRAEKLLHLADKRAVQSATTLVTQNRNKRKRRDGDELLEIAETVELEKKRRKLDGVGAGAREEVVLKGTGKAIQKVLELALWFQQRNEYAVQLKTGSVGAIDDVTIDNALDEPVVSEEMVADHRTDEDEMPLDSKLPERKSKGTQQKQPAEPWTFSKDDVPETRLRYTSVLEVFVSLR